MSIINGSVSKQSVPWEYRLELITRGGRSVLIFVFLAFPLLLFRFSEVDKSLWLQFQFNHGALTTTGVVDSVTDTGQRTGRNHNGPPVFLIAYTFPTQNGSQQQGISYCTGQEDPLNQECPLKPDDQVSIEYRPDHPLLSHIQGMSMMPFDSGTMVLPILTMAFLLLVIVCAMVNQTRTEGLLAIRLLESGEHAQAKITKMVLIPKEYRSPKHYQVSFLYITLDGSTHTVVKDYYSQPKPEWLAYLKESPDRADLAPQETILYDPNNADSCVVLSLISPRLSVRADGTLVGANLARSLAYCLPPVILLTSIVWYIVWITNGGLMSAYR